MRVESSSFVDDCKSPDPSSCGYKNPLSDFYSGTGGSSGPPGQLEVQIRLDVDQVLGFVGNQTSCPSEKTPHGLALQSTAGKPVWQSPSFRHATQCMHYAQYRSPAGSPVQHTYSTVLYCAWCQNDAKMIQCFEYV